MLTPFPLMKTLGVAAGGPHVLVARDGPVAGALRNGAVLELPLVEEEQFVGLSQRSERGLPVVARSDPELGIGQVECADCNIADHPGERSDQMVST